MLFRAEGHDRINVQNNPVNWVDPWGLVSAGQLGIGNPGSYGGANTCESMYDERGLFSVADFIYTDFSDVPITLGEIPVGPGSGIYEFISASGKRYVGQTVNFATRIARHLRSGKLLPGQLNTLRITEIKGGRVTREIAEQLRINELGGLRNLENVRNPIGPARQYLLP